MYPTDRVILKEQQINLLCDKIGMAQGLGFEPRRGKAPWDLKLYTTKER